ncbi:right-handed parallel beta-helix repeat-containing protein [Horticoccus luteus]|uniref:Right-handed parallel beta-helix repeat-containing protein n=2 Tax=Horticoccus luteus TaxID=2862869 RepID=A0A8F9U0E8_9BACT|nr:right-handed parallel beta-helix repeat-containing protein [Horticoccus luteus]
MTVAVLLLVVALAPGARAAAGNFDVKDFGAAGDGKTLDTEAVNQAIAAAAGAGGGVVTFLAGDYLTFSIRLRSHVTLFLAPGATIVAAEPPANLEQGYDAPEANPGTDQYQDFGHSHWHNSLIWGEGLVDIGIVGPGRIYGRGLSRGKGGVRRDLLPEERTQSAVPELSFAALPAFQAALHAQKTGPFGYPGDDLLPPGVGNKAIALKNCRNVIFRDFTIYHGGHFAVLATGVDNWTCDNLTIDTNRDGIDIDCCQGVRVSNCIVNSPYDDGICLKSSYGLGFVRMTENVTITNCQVSGFAEGTLLDGTRRKADFGERGPTGRIKFGTESNGGFRNITVSNCTFDYSRGLALEAVDGAQMEDITITGLTMRDITNAPIFIRLGRRQRGPEQPAIGTTRRIKIDTLVAHAVAADGGILIVGTPGHPVEDVSLSNILIDYVGGGTAEQARGRVPEDERFYYPEPSGLGVRPAWGLFARNVKNLSLDRVDLRLAHADARPAMVLEKVDGAVLDRVAFPGEAERNLVRKDVTGLRWSDGRAVAN